MGTTQIISRTAKPASTKNDANIDVRNQELEQLVKSIAAVINALEVPAVLQTLNSVLSDRLIEAGSYSDEGDSELCSYALDEAESLNNVICAISECYYHIKSYTPLNS
ncbi:hypothetical protein H8S90_21240 [Olivibacter sp. SDN3]|uniref:hypothetical protein n=1 Tax=Olivibacter sp. SDN3 TaxID=2764720 RepID=UPI0016518A0A|nr:hypothetical protein [Olivibacter sp. SDN3]QNL49237.1 hypothetical protein H8S90_21240 [Olivibacter sp. SDN3]